MINAKKLNVHMLAHRINEEWRMKRKSKTSLAENNIPEAVDSVTEAIEDQQLRLRFSAAFVVSMLTYNMGTWRVT